VEGPPRGGIGEVRGGGPHLPRHPSPRHNHMSSEHRTKCSSRSNEADSDRLDTLFLSLRRSVSSKRLPYGQI